MGLLAAACVAMLLFVKLTQGPEIVGRPPSDHELAEAHRTMAEESCGRRDWVACKASLDEAAKLNPAGETEPRVQTARQAIAAGMAGHSPKPGPSIDGEDAEIRVLCALCVSAAHFSRSVSPTARTPPRGRY